jgi:hypothetical protein
VLTTREIKVICDIVKTESITIPTLQDDVVDHLCCVVEYKLESGQVFEKAIKEAIQELAPNGLHEIERETIFLLNYNRTIQMKKVMYLIGLISTMALSLGWLFRFLRWPGGDELANYGFLGFSLLFVPMLAINQFRVSINKALPEKLRIILGLSSGLVTCLAVLFKTMHYPGADILLLSGAALFIFGFLPFLFFTMYKKSIS